MKEKLSKFIEKFKSFGGKISGIKGITAIIPAVCLAVLMLTVLTGYQTPKAKKYNASETDISQIKEALANESTTAKATAATTKKNTTKKGKKGAIDLKDGTYKGSANGYGGKVTVNVTVSKKTMTAIDIVSAPGETDSFFSRAKGVIDEMLTAQSTDVDVVSGATYSSNGIIGAVKNALYGTESNNATAASAGSSNTNAGGSAPSVSKVKESGSWKDGTYTGSGKGFGGNISVKVTVKDGKIKSIDVTSASGETASYFSKAKGIIPKIISGQTTNVDVASGATYSSNGIIKAVRNALSKAGTSKSSTEKKSKKKKKKNTKKKSNNGTNKTTIKADPNPGASVPYDNGTYSGSGEGFGGTIKVSVTIKNHKITTIAVTSAPDETPEYFEKAKGLISNVIKKQSADVDVVSGATYSSNGLIEAIKNALKEAEKATSKNNSSDKNNSQNDNKKDDATTETKKDDASESTTEIKPEDTTEEDGDTYKNGTYSVSVTCEPDERNDFSAYKISVDITIKKDKITGVSNIVADTNSSNKIYVRRAQKGMVSSIITNGTADGVDTVSGATCSSKAIKEACQKAFDAAKK